MKMKIKSVQTHTVTFSVQSFEDSEGGMDHKWFGKEVGDIGAAIQQLQLAQASGRDGNWMIVCDVKTDVGTSEVA